MKSVLVLEDGTYFTGEAFGKTGEVVGEIVFNTCMTGYQEILTNPSYNGQIVAMTYPLIGNYGFNRYDNELKIGLFQLLSYFPGFSRSAASIGGGMLSGLTREAAAQFSFLLGAPTLLAAGGYELLKSGFSFTMQEWAVLLVGCLFSFLSAYLVVKPFLQFVSKRSYKPFIIYRVVLGALLLVMYFL